MSEQEIQATRESKDRKCSVAGCVKKFYAKGHCKMHYNRIRKFGSTSDEFKTKKHLWKGEWIRAGRVFIYSPDHPTRCKRGFVPRYRLVAESVLGRYLLPGEVVHHKNSNPMDDRPENLTVTNNSNHAKIHDLHGMGFKAQGKTDSINKRKRKAS